jgi:hypothetical protein
MVGGRATGKLWIESANNWRERGHGLHGASPTGSKASYSTDSDYSTLDASDASSAVQYVLLFGESVPYLARTRVAPLYPKAPFCLCA